MKPEKPFKPDGKAQQLIEAVSEEMAKPTAEDYSRAEKLARRVGSFCYQLYKAILKEG